MARKIHLHHSGERSFDLREAFGGSAGTARLLLLPLWRNAVCGPSQELEDVLYFDKGEAVVWLLPLTKCHFTLIQNIKLAPFEQCVSPMDSKSAMNLSGALASPSTAYIYDRNLLPIGLIFWHKELMSYKRFSPLQEPESYNLDGILKDAEGDRSEGD